MSDINPVKILYISFYLKINQLLTTHHINTCGKHFFSSRFNPDVSIDDNFFFMFMFFTVMTKFFGSTGLKIDFKRARCGSQRMKN